MVNIPLLVGGAGAGLNLLGGLFGSSKASKEYKRMRQFLERAYNDYINNPLYLQSKDFALQLLKGGDYNNIFLGAYNNALMRNRANLLNAKNEAHAVAARGGFLRGGQQQDLLGRVRESAFQADRGASQDYAANQFGAKQYASQLADSLAKGPFQAATQIAPNLINPYAGDQWNILANFGKELSNFGVGQYGQQQQQNYLKNLLT